MSIKKVRAFFLRQAFSKIDFRNSKNAKTMKLLHCPPRPARENV